MLERTGYQELIPPTFEYEETFLRAGGADVAERLVRFPDRDGRILALRYDFTASLARMAATTFSQASLPLRLSYSGIGVPARSGAGRTASRDPPGRRRVVGQGRPRRGRGDRSSHPRAGGGNRTSGLPDQRRARRGSRARSRGSRGAAAGRCTALDRPEGSWQSHQSARGPVRRHSCPDPAPVRHRPARGAGAGAPGIARAHATGTATSSGAGCRAHQRRARPRGIRPRRGAWARLLHRYSLRGLRRGNRTRSRGRRRYDDLMGRFGRPMPAVGVSLDLDALAEVPL